LVGCGTGEVAGHQTAPRASTSRPIDTKVSRFAHGARVGS
jgi:hypothetical protein